MTYMNCPRCGLSVRFEVGQAEWELCPRCLGRAGVAVPVYMSEQGAPEPNADPDAVAGADPSADPGLDRALDPALDAPAEHHLSISSSHSGDECVVTLAGELDLATFSRLDGRLHDLERDPPARLVLDLQALTFLDSTGLATIVAADLRARSDGRRLELRCGDGQARQLLALTGLEQALTLV